MQTETPPDEIEIDLSYYLYLLRRRWKLIVLLAVEAAIVAFIFSRLQTPIYQASTRLIINPTANSTSASVELNGLRASQLLADTFVQLATSKDVLSNVSAELGESLGSVSASPINGTMLVMIRVNDDNPVVAAQTANLVADESIEFNQSLQLNRYAQSETNLRSQLDFLEAEIAQTRMQINSVSAANIEQRTLLETQLAQYNRDYTSLLQSYESVRLQALQSTPNIVQLEKASVPLDPIRPRVALNTLLGLVIGLVAGVGYVFLRELLDDTVRDPELLAQRTGYPVLGHILAFDTEKEELVTKSSPRSPYAESFRSLRLSIRYANVDEQVRSVMVTSASPSEGKSTLIANLAIVTAQSGQGTLLIDSDLRKPRQHRIFGISNISGFSQRFLEPVEQLDDTPLPTAIENLTLLPSGPLPPNPSDLFDSQKAFGLIERATQVADLVLVDTPPVMALSDSVALSRHVDGVLLVVRAGQTRLKSVQQAIARLEQVDADIIGLALTGISKDMMQSGYYYKYYGAYEYYSDESGSPNTRKPKRQKKKQQPSPSVNQA